MWPVVVMGGSKLGLEQELEQLELEESFVTEFAKHKDANTLSL